VNKNGIVALAALVVALIIGLGVMYLAINYSGH
jgi:hypothetical protein